MAHWRLPLRREQRWRIAGALCACLACLLPAACGGPTSFGPDEPAPNPFPLRLSAEWLQSQPGGQSYGRFEFHLLDEAARPLADWSGLEIREAVSADGGLDFSLFAHGPAPDDIYLYVTYPGESYALDSAELDPSQAQDYLFLAVPHRLRDVLVTGLSRLADKRGSRVSGPLLQLHFRPGSERSFRHSSDVNADPGSAPLLSLGLQGAGTVALQWTERNIGDYNNNSQVEIADITPVGIYFGQQAAGAADPQAIELVDGDRNGEINVADLTPIGRNFGRYIQGYSVYRAVGASPSADDFAALGQPSIERQPVLDATPLPERKHRLEFSYDAATQVGENHFYVCAWSGDSGSSTEGPASNTVSLSVLPGNQPPVWVSTTGITAASGLVDSIRINFGQATDPEGTDITYVLRYIDAADGILGSPQTQSVDIPAAELNSGPPYTYDLPGLLQSHSYLLNLRARDADGVLTSNSEVSNVTIPYLAESSAPWAYERKDLARSAASPGLLLEEPLEIAWQQSLPAGTEGAPRQLAAAESGEIGIVCGKQRVLRFAAGDGAPLPTLSLPQSWADFGLAADGEVYLVATDSGWESIVNDSSFALAYPFAGVNLGALLCGPALLHFHADSHSAMSYPQTEQLWTADSPAGASWSCVPACDAAHLFAADSAGGIRRYSLADGAAAGSMSLAVNEMVLAIAADLQRSQLVVLTSARLLLLDATTLGILHAQPFAAEADAPALCLAPQGSAPLCAVLDRRETSPDVFAWRALAYSLTDLSPLWEASGYASGSAELDLVSAQTRLLAGVGGEMHVIDFEGRVRQSLTLGNAETVELGLAYGQSYFSSGDQLYALRHALSDGPPVWQGVSAKPGGGIRSLSDLGGGQLQVDWDYAVDDHALPVYYSIYYSADEAPEFTAPFTHTSLVTDIPDNGLLAHSYQLGPLDTSKRWYVGVRASDRPWTDSPNTDANTNWLALTPGWQSEELLLGADLPAGEVYFMRGLADPAGSLHLFYNDRVSTLLTHVYGTPGNWSNESNGLTTHPAIAFEPAWDSGASQLLLGVADSADVFVLRRTGADTWSKLNIGNTIPVTNPMLSLAYHASGSGAAALAYTQLINPALPPDEDYYISQTSSTDVWQPAVELDPLNFSGRDLSTLFYPPGANEPWTLLQRGYTYAPNRFTPQNGELAIARGDGAGGWLVDTIDSGANAPESDCGKRCQLRRSGPDGDPLLHAAYLDLNASGDAPIAELRYARHESGDWSTELVGQFDISFQTASLQFTYGELGFALESGRPVIACLVRGSAGSTATDPHYARLWLYTRQGAGSWSATVLTEPELVFPRDREPCVLLESSGSLHIFFASNADELDPRADRIVHLWREPAV